MLKRNVDLVAFCRSMLMKRARSMDSDGSLRTSLHEGPRMSRVTLCHRLSSPITETVGGPLAVGEAVVGEAVGASVVGDVGVAVVGDAVGEGTVGEAVGANVVGDVGAAVGASVG